MPVYKIHRLKSSQRQQFRSAPHAKGASNVKPRDYEPAGSVEGESAYSAWLSLRNSEQSLDVGDILELEDGQLRIFKYIGFEEAHWVLPEVAPAAMSATAANGASADIR